MPSYDFICKKCNENFTIEKSMNDETKPKCPKCNSDDVLSPSVINQQGITLTAAH